LLGLLQWLVQSTGCCRIASLNAAGFGVEPNNHVFLVLAVLIPTIKIFSFSYLLNYVIIAPVSGNLHRGRSVSFDANQKQFEDSKVTSFDPLIELS
jgi:hypothetical protein